MPCLQEDWTQVAHLSSSAAYRSLPARLPARTCMCWCQTCPSAARLVQCHPAMPACMPSLLPHFCLCQVGWTGGLGREGTQTPYHHLATPGSVCQACPGAYATLPPAYHLVPHLAFFTAPGICLGWKPYACCCGAIPPEPHCSLPATPALQFRATPGLFARALVHALPPFACLPWTLLDYNLHLLPLLCWFCALPACAHPTCATAGSPI